MTTSARNIDPECTGAGRQDFTLCTKDLNAREGRTQWVDALDSTYCEMDVAWPRNDSAFEGDLTGNDMADMYLSRVTADPHRVTRSRSMIDSDDRDDFLLVLIAEGEATLSQHGRTTALTRGSFGVLDLAEPFSVEGVTGFDQIVLNAPRETLTTRLPEGILSSTVGVEFSGTSGLSGMLSRFLIDLSSTNSLLSGMERASVSGTVMDMLATTVGDQSVVDDTTRSRHQDLRRLQQDMIRNLHRADRGLQEVSSDLGMSVRYTHKLFEQTDLTPRGFLTDERMKRARWLLLDSNQTVADITARVGYRDTAHFSRAFKAHFGTSPSRFRSSGRSAAS